MHSLSISPRRLPRMPKPSSTARTLRVSTSALSGASAVIALTRVRHVDLHVVILTQNASIATELVTLRATASPDADLDPDPRTDADGTLAPTLPVIAVEAAMTATTADALLTEDEEALLAVIATIVVMIADMTTADKVAVATATRAAMTGATTKDVMVAVMSVDAHPSVVAPARHLAVEAPLLEKRKEGDPDLVIPVSKKDVVTTWIALEVLRKTMLREFNRMSAKLTMQLLTAVTTPKGRSAAHLEMKVNLSPSRTTSEQLVCQKVN